MGWISHLHGSIVGLDTAPIIYFVEESAPYLDALIPFFADFDEGKFRIVTSTITLLEVLVHPMRSGDEALAQKYNDILLSSPNIATHPVTFAIAEKAAELRAAYQLKTPDAIQLAVAINHGATRFLTNDRRIPAIPGLEIIRLMDLV